jgi:hypothetical protein
LEVKKMKTTFKLILFVIGFVIGAMALANPAFAATNAAVDGLGGILLGASGTVTVTSTQLGLVKAVLRCMRRHKHCSSSDRYEVNLRDLC